MAMKRKLKQMQNRNKWQTWNRLLNFSKTKDEKFIQSGIVKCFTFEWMIQLATRLHSCLCSKEFFFCSSWISNVTHWQLLSSIHNVLTKSYENKKINENGPKMITLAYLFVRIYISNIQMNAYENSHSRSSQVQCEFHNESQYIAFMPRIVDISIAYQSICNKSYF